MNVRSSRLRKADNANSMEALIYILLRYVLKLYTFTSHWWYISVLKRNHPRKLYADSHKKETRKNMVEFYIGKNYKYWRIKSLLKARVPSRRRSNPKRPDDVTVYPLPFSASCFASSLCDLRWRGHIDFKSRVNGQPPDPATSLLSLVGVGNHPASQSANQPANLPTCQLTIHPTTATTYPLPPLPSARRHREREPKPPWSTLSSVAPGSWSCVRLTRFQWIQCRGRSYRIWKREINECFSRSRCSTPPIRVRDFRRFGALSN